MNKGIERAFNKLNIQYDTFFYQFSDWENDDKFLEMFSEKLKGGKYKKVFSVNYSPLISKVCESLGIKYLSWVYDCPIHIRDISSMSNSCNTIFFFDYNQAQSYRKMGVDARHLTLAADVELLRVVIEKNNWGIRHDISLLGQLYKTEYANYTALLNDYYRGYLGAIINTQMKLFGAYIIPELLTNELLDNINKEYASKVNDGFKMDSRTLSYMMAQETTSRERFMALALLSKHFNVDLYSSDTDERLTNVSYHGYADYETIVPSIFAGSKINLNISLKCIESGIPLRCIEVMGCGGFLLSNYQSELVENMKIGTECEVYESLEDLYEKSAFYMKNEELRKKIADCGLEKIKRDFRFEDRLSVILNTN